MVTSTPPPHSTPPVICLSMSHRVHGPIVCMSHRVYVPSYVCPIVCMSHRVYVPSCFKRGTGPLIQTQLEIIRARCQESWLDQCVVAEASHEPFADETKGGSGVMGRWKWPSKSNMRRLSSGFLDSRLRNAASRLPEQWCRGCHRETWIADLETLLRVSPRSNEADIDRLPASHPVSSIPTRHTACMTVCLFPRYVCPSDRVFPSGCFSVRMSLACV